MKKFNIKETNWYGLDHSAVNKKFKGNLTYCNTFCVLGEYSPVSVYKAKNPNKKLGHKKYMLLQIDNSGGCVRGMTSQEMKKERYQDAVICQECYTLLYSINRHHFQTCGCPNETSVDGGKDYLKYGFKKTKPLVVKFDLITNKIINK